MMITGYDAVLISATPPAPVVEDFLRHWMERWPAMRIAVEGVTGSEFVVWSDRPVPLPAERAEILIARDEGMVEAWDREGYRPGADGEGPLQIMYQPCPAPHLRMLALDDPYGRTGFAFEPYEVLLAGPGLSLVTTVTPDRDSAFSKLVIDEITALFS